eukprot:1532676-Rhodomonas_salina.2
MLGLQRRVNQLRSERVEKERVLKEWTAMKTGTARLVFLVAKGEELDVEETEVARRLAELEEVIQHEEKERRTREHVVRRLETVIARFHRARNGPALSVLALNRTFRDRL